MFSNLKIKKKDKIIISVEMVMLLKKPLLNFLVKEEKKAPIYLKYDLQPVLQID